MCEAVLKVKKYNISEIYHCEIWLLDCSKTKIEGTFQLYESAKVASLIPWICCSFFFLIMFIAIAEYYF